MNKSKLNFIIDAIMFILMGIIAGLGLLIKYVLLSGEGRWIKYGKNVNITFMELDRHQWGKIHLIVALILIGFLILHIILHWKMIICLCKSLISNKGKRVFIVLIFSLGTIICVVFPFLIQTKVDDLALGKERFQGHSEHSYSDSLTNTKNKRHIKSTVVATVEEKHADEHHNIDTSIEVKGYMTLQEVSNKYNISCELIKKKLNVSSSVNNNSKLGQLRKTYGFKMSEIELIIYNYKNSGIHEKDN